MPSLVIPLTDKVYKAGELPASWRDEVHQSVRKLVGSKLAGNATVIPAHDVWNNGESWLHQLFAIVHHPDKDVIGALHDSLLATSREGYGQPLTMRRWFGKDVHRQHAHKTDLEHGHLIRLMERHNIPYSVIISPSEGNHTVVGVVPKKGYGTPSDPTSLARPLDKTAKARLSSFIDELLSVPLGGQI